MSGIGRAMLSLVPALTCIFKFAESDAGMRMTPADVPCSFRNSASCISPVLPLPQTTISER